MRPRGKKISNPAGYGKRTCGGRRKKTGDGGERGVARGTTAWGPVEGKKPILAI